MKQSDIFSIIIIATVGTLASYFGVNAFLGDPNLESANVKTIEAISPDLETPDSELFNPAAINPTVEVYVGDCEDVDQNGILSKEELIACGKVTEEEISDFVLCPDGETYAKDSSQCPAQEKKEESSNNANNENNANTNVNNSNANANNCPEGTAFLNGACVTDSNQ